MANQGMWLQPEPLLGFNPHLLDHASPPAYSDAYARALPTNYSDVSGWDPALNRVNANTQTATLGWRPDRGKDHKVAGPHLYASAQPSAVQAGVSLLRTSPADGDAQASVASVGLWAGLPRLGQGEGKSGLGFNLTLGWMMDVMDNGVGIGFKFEALTADFEISVDQSGKGATIDAGVLVVGSGFQIGGNDPLSSDDVTLKIARVGGEGVTAGVHVTDVDDDTVDEVRMTFPSPQLRGRGIR